MPTPRHTRRRRRLVGIGALALTLPLAAVPMQSASAQDDEPLLATDFETGGTEGWGARIGTETVTATDIDAHSGQYSLLTTDRTESYTGPALNLLDIMEAGESYDIGLWIKLAAGAEPADLRVSIQRDLDDGSQFDTVVGDTAVTDGEWVNLTGRFTLAGQVNGLSIYVESASEPVPFHIDDFELRPVTTPPIEQDIPSLKDVLADDFPIGTAIDQREITGLPAELLTKHFNSITAENAMKWESIEPVEGEFDFTEADALVEFAEQHGIRIWGHTLIWHSQTPDWVFQDAEGEPLTDSPDDQALLLQRMENHINGIAEHYGDRIWAWDVVNEVISEGADDGLRRSPWYEILGPDYIAHAFDMARAAFPEAKLFINDYNTEFPDKRTAMFDVVSGLIDAGVPVDGVGHQFHVNLTRPVSLIDDSITTFAELDILQAVTELDVSISTSTSESLPEPPPDRLIRQGYYYRDMFEVLRGHSDVLASVSVWGLYDARSWLRTWPIDRPHEAPLFFDDDLQSKPAYWGVVDPSQLPHFPQERNVTGATPTVDGERDVEWDLLPQTVLGTDADGAPTGFQVRWDSDRLTVLAEVADDTVDDADRVEFYVDDANAKNGDYTDGDAHYTVGRDGAVDGAATAQVRQTDTGYRVEAALPLATPGELGRQIGFDIRVTDGEARSSWSDQDHAQDTDTSRWGTITLIEPVASADVPYADDAPQIDGDIDDAWQSAPSIHTGIVVEGAADGATADARLLWDEQRLYVLAEVTDPSLSAGSSNPWEQDSVEIFVDPDNTKSGPYKSDDGQYRISFENVQTIGGDPDAIGDNLTSATRVVDGGYIVEASIELTGMTAGPGSFVGLDLQVNDGTDDVRTSVHTWHDPTGLSYQDTSRWGVARLVTAEAGCDHTVSGTHVGALKVDAGVTCVAAGSRVIGPIKVRPGAGLIVTNATVYGPLTTHNAEIVDLSDGAVIGPVGITGTTDRVSMTGMTVIGPVKVHDNSTGDTPIVVSDNVIVGPLTCRGNEPPPTDDGVPNTVIGPVRGQCTG